MKRPSLAILLLLLCANLAWSQEADRRMYLTIGVGYDQGDFGLPALSRAAYTPFSLRYEASPHFEIGVSSAVARIDSPGGVEIIDGIPTRTDRVVTPIRETGLTDTTIRSRFFLVTDDGLGPPKTAVTPFFKVKIPTAPADEGLGTGKADYGFGVEMDRDLGSAFVFGDAAYTVIGKVRGLALRDRPSASIGIGKQLGSAVTVSSILDWRRSIVTGNPDPAELTGVLSFRAGSAVLISPNAFVGLTNGTSDFGVGIQMRVRLSGS